MTSLARNQGPGFLPVEDIATLQDKKSEKNAKTVENFLNY